MKTGYGILGVCLALLCCVKAVAKEEPPTTAGDVDLVRYQGLWYEQARLPMFFQRGCVASTAEYKLDPSFQVDVINRCRTKDGKQKEAIGKAWPQHSGSTDKLWVRFDNWFSRLAPSLTKGEYWILYVDPNYQYADVGDSQRKYLWLLSRQERINAPTREALLMVARDKGYDVDRLLWRE
mgnify:CR=1 FL=1